MADFELADYIIMEEEALPEHGEDSDVFGSDGIDAPTNIEDAAEDINTASFNELHLPASGIKEVREAWALFLSCFSTREAAAEAMYNSIFESAPSLQSLFTTPKAIQSMRFLDEVCKYIDLLSQPKQLKNLVETLAFRHLNLEVTVPRAMIFRDAIVDLVATEMDGKMSDEARLGMMALLGWVGGANIFVKANYGDRLRKISDSWRKVSSAASKAEQAREAARREAEEAEAARRNALKEGANANDKEDGEEILEVEDENEFELQVDVQEDMMLKNELENEGASRFWDCGCCARICPRLCGKTPAAARAKGDAERDEAGKEEKGGGMMGEAGQSFVPSTYREMYECNCQIMGFGVVGGWMEEILNSFDNIVGNVTDAVRLQEECDMLAIRIDKVNRGMPVPLAQYRSCMLASLRSLLPKDWDSSYEAAWNWLWDNVERLIEKHLGMTEKWEPALTQLLASLDEDYRYKLRADIFKRFFASTPAGQEFFKQSDTRLHFIADRVLEFTTELFRDPWQMVDNISALGLRHVGYGVPTDFFGAFVTACVEVIQTATTDPVALESFRWSLGLIAKQLVRTISEGSTIVMKAVNLNSKKLVAAALATAPRGQRAKWLLKVQVGTQSISPLYWAIESGSLAAAEAVIQDLLVIRADRERYYYGCDDLFYRHQDIVARLCREAPALLPTLLDGLVWRSTRTENGKRRANYYVKHLVTNAEGGVADALKEICNLKDPKIMVNSTIVVVSDALWNGSVRNNFMLSRIWFIVSLALFMISQAILPKIPALKAIYGLRVVIFVSRTLVYLVTMCRLTFEVCTACILDFAKGRWKRMLVCIPWPRFLNGPQGLGKFILSSMLICMFAHEPMYICVAHDPETWPSDDCSEANIIATRRRYSVFGLVAMAVHWFLMVDLAVFSTGLSAFVLVCAQVLNEIGRFLVALIFLLLTFASSISVLNSGYFEMRDIGNSLVALFSITVLLYEDDYRSLMFEPALLIAVFLFVLASSILLMNLLIAQLNNSYVFIYQDMVGFARLNRAQRIVDALSHYAMPRWSSFVEALAFDTVLEFNKGDVGFGGGLQIEEPASERVVLKDTIIRFGGSCSPDMMWPEEKSTRAEKDKLSKVEALCKKALRKVTRDLKVVKKSGVSGASQDHTGSGGLSGVSGISDSQGGGHSGVSGGFSGVSGISD
eukprot:TRINITY_DN29251_c0_g1_i1.p1 TRINITY_DN29251_c0_g1~~TRINITY_DN29251_c0_g1_i1.p1  ORF type:complete len:1177 (+),score=268.20 TRINITY_DN29251_c0_g1_i1:131-3661(+)